MISCAMGCIDWPRNIKVAFISNNVTAAGELWAKLKKIVKFYSGEITLKCVNFAAVGYHSLLKFGIGGIYQRI